MSGSLAAFFLLTQDYVLCQRIVIFFIFYRLDKALIYGQLNQF